MISQVNIESTIGIKRLSEADLGTSATSNQTHIGLFDGTLNFIEVEHQIISSQLIYNNQVTELLSLLDFIENPDGSFRSPKIRKGNEPELVINNSRVNSVVREIREITNGTTSNWYLLWFGLDTNELVFHLFSDDSTDSQEIQQIIGQIGTRRQIENTSTEFGNLINYLSQKVDAVNIEYYEELEISTQTNTEKVTKRIIPRVRDIEKANKLFKETGLKGEELLFQYLELQKSNDFIKDFKWMNQSKETGFPYDFEIINNDNSLIYSDAKATRYKFEQPIILSSGELSFINENKDKYLIHRMYSVFDEPKLRICENISKVSDIFIPNYNSFNSTLKNEKLAVQGIKLAVPTNLEILTFENEILLNATA
tara:strand:- start:227 stop:1330 length:1104 start_codon:yes stop_codon:yes gene_type:complete